MPFGVVTLTTVETARTGPTGETIDTPRHRALGTASRVTILKLVRDAEGGMTAAEVAERTGQHLSTTRTHLDRLVEAGLLVKARASGGQAGRPAWRYR
ncbi:helix-turn-helix domain-containing protein, partial [Micromonospora globispora]|uniref:helix-turn-helix domain-containing protein n=1 Tax=Micromonospora globispora TaxID=1450148 RepID=UPI001403304B